MVNNKPSKAKIAVETGLSKITVGADRQFYKRAAARHKQQRAADEAAAEKEKANKKPWWK